MYVCMYMCMCVCVFVCGNPVVFSISNTKRAAFDWISVSLAFSKTRCNILVSGIWKISLYRQVTWYDYRWKSGESRASAPEGALIFARLTRITVRIFTKITHTHTKKYVTPRKKKHIYILLAKHIYICIASVAQSSVFRLIFLPRQIFDDTFARKIGIARRQKISHRRRLRPANCAERIFFRGQAPIKWYLSAIYKSKEKRLKRDVNFSRGKRGSKSSHRPVNCKLQFLSADLSWNKYQTTRAESIRSERFATCWERWGVSARSADHSRTV